MSVFLGQVFAEADVKTAAELSTVVDSLCTRVQEESGTMTVGVGEVLRMILGTDTLLASLLTGRGARHAKEMTFVSLREDIQVDANKLADSVAAELSRLGHSEATSIHLAKVFFKSSPAKCRELLVLNWNCLSLAYRPPLSRRLQHVLLHPRLSLQTAASHRRKKSEVLRHCLRITEYFLSSPYYPFGKNDYELLRAHINDIDSPMALLCFMARSAHEGICYDSLLKMTGRVVDNTHRHYSEIMGELERRYNRPEASS